MRLLLITNVFPSPALPTKGPFNGELVRALSRGHSVRVICPVAWTDEWKAARLGRPLPEGRTSALDGAAGVRVYHPRYYFTPKVLRGQYGRFMWHSVRGLVKEQVESFKPDAVIGYWIHPDGEVAVRAARLAGVPSAVIVGGSDLLLLTRGRDRRKRILRVLAAADAVIPVSQALRQKLIDLGVAAGKVHVVPRGVDTARFSPGDRVEARRRLGVPAGAPVMLWVGRMHRVKGLDVLVEACAGLRSDGMPFRVYLVGEGPESEALRARVAELGLQQAFSFVGSVAHRDLADWYRAADVTVLPSRSEGIPNVLRESLACGTPFVATRVGGISEITEDSCRLVPPEDPAALKAALAQALIDGLASALSGRDRQLGCAVPGSWYDSAEALVRVLRPLNARRQSAAQEPAHAAVG